jgi:hypothetical protein
VGADRLIVAVLAIASLVGCQPGTSPLQALLPQQGPQIIVPPGVVSTQTAQGVAQKMLDEIAANEGKLGRPLAAPRIIRIQLLRPGEPYEVRHFDGTNPDGEWMSPDSGPGWMVEAVGTFLGVDHRTGQIVSRGTHAFHLWDDDGGESSSFIPCWTIKPAPAGRLEGACP